MPLQSAAPATPALVASAPAIPNYAMVASAARLPVLAKPVHQSTDLGWQTECYRHYAICGEARYAARFFGHVLSRATLSIGRPNVEASGGIEVVKEGPAVEALSDLFKGPNGQAQMLEAIGVHLTIAGECWLVGRQAPVDPNKPDGPKDDLWEIVSVLEMKVGGVGATQKWSIEHDGYRPIDLTDSDVVIRIWNPDPAKRTRADSPFKSLLPVLGEIELATRHIFNQMTSRLTGAGIMFVSQGLSFPPPPPVPGVNPGDPPAAVPTDAEQLMALLAQVMTASKLDDNSPASMVPIVITVPEELMKNGKPADLMHFWSALDEKAMEMRDKNIGRFAIGLDMPPEQLMGMSSNGGTGGGNSNGVSHWGAWQVEESTVKMFAEPALELVTNSITVYYIRPQLEVGAPEKVVYSTAALRLRPDRSKEAVSMRDHGSLKEEVMLRENGFDPNDAMEPEEHQKWLLTRIASGQTPATPEMVNAALKALGLDLGVQVTPGAQPSIARPDPAAVPVDRPRTPAEAALLPVCHSLVLRALERAGNRLRQAVPGGREIAAGLSSSRVHTAIAANGSTDAALKDAWTSAHEVLGYVECSQHEVVALLDAYCRELLATQQPHTYEAMADWLTV